MSDAEKIAQVTARLAGGYHLEPSRTGYAVVCKDGTRFTDGLGREIVFARLDAEKIVRLYNEDAWRAT